MSIILLFMGKKGIDRKINDTTTLAVSLSYWRLATAPVGSLASIWQLSFIASRKLFSRLPFVLLLLRAVSSPQTENNLSTYVWEADASTRSRATPLPPMHLYWGYFDSQYCTVSVSSLRDFSPQFIVMPRWQSIACRSWCDRLLRSKLEALWSWWLTLHGVAVELYNCTFSSCVQFPALNTTLVSLRGSFAQIKFYWRKKLQN